MLGVRKTQSRARDHITSRAPGQAAPILDQKTQRFGRCGAGAASKVDTDEWLRRLKVTIASLRNARQKLTDCPAAAPPDFRFLANPYFQIRGVTASHRGGLRFPRHHDADHDECNTEEILHAEPFAED